ncbi:unnamed protein product [Cylicostephanus goldi]|uniref:Uncharacterized protein n=1 Tax=Cylicostephanus goldi TaxID=71465 RepID=A0A3P7QBR6_CYLGO|nr:unnamed protein product [Cylicostephanus goldi]
MVWNIVISSKCPYDLVHTPIRPIRHEDTAQEDPDSRPIMRLLLSLLAIVAISYQEETAKKPVHEGDTPLQQHNRGQGVVKKPHRDRQFQIQGVDVREDRVRIKSLGL